MASMIRLELGHVVPNLARYGQLEAIFRPQNVFEEKNMPLDHVDRRLLEVLQRDGRVSNVALAERVHLSPSPCLRRLKALEHDGVIEGYRAVLDREAVGLGLTVFVEIKVEGHSDRLAEAIEEAVAKMPEVVACHIVSGAADFLLEVVVPDLRGYEGFLLGSLLKLPAVTDVRSNFAIRTVKPPGPLPLGHLA
jgi:Lrp/AsnC family transcriptional regulator, leucine-responsive regulatory protein